MKISKTTIGQRIKLIRQSRGMTQAAVADRLGTIQSNISDIERGARKPTIEQLVNLSRIFGARIDEMLASTAPESESSFLKDRRFLSRLQKIDQLSTSDKQALLKNLDMFLKGAGVA